MKKKLRKCVQEDVYNNVHLCMYVNVCMCMYVCIYIYWKCVESLVFSLFECFALLVYLFCLILSSSPNPNLPEKPLRCFLYIHTYPLFVHNHKFFCGKFLTSTSPVPISVPIRIRLFAESGSKENQEKIWNLLCAQSTSKSLFIFILLLIINAFTVRSVFLLHIFT